MGNVASTMLALLLLQLAAATGWGWFARWSRPLSLPASHWCAFSLTSSIALALALGRHGGLPGPVVDLSSVVAIGALLALRRGLRLMLRQTSADAEAWAVLGVVAAGLAAAPGLPGEQATTLRIGLDALAFAWVLLRTAADAWHQLRLEFGDRHGYLLVSPFIAGASLFLARVAVLPLPWARSALLPAESSFNLALITLLLVLTVMVHGSLAAIVVVRALRKLQALSQHDALTGVLSRGEWLHRLRTQHRWLARHGEPFSVLMVDIDHFKSINDTLGHAAGDRVLTALAQVLVEGAREVDVVGRIGGEEFAVLLPRTVSMGALGTAERLRRAAADIAVLWQDRTIALTVSIGIAVCDDAVEQPQALMGRADKAMYQAKRGGRNRTAIAEPADVAPRAEVREST